MNKPLRYALAGLVALSFLTGCSTTPASSSEGNVSTYAQTWQEAGPSVVTHTELAADVNHSAARVTTPEPATGFALDAIKGGLREMTLGQLAVSHGTSPSVQRLGRMVADDHAQANAELKKMVGAKGLTLPNEDALVDESRDRLASLSGPAFDMAYVQTLIEGHRKDLDLFEREARTGLDAELRNYAERKLPVLRQHMERARQLQDELGR